MANYTAGVAGVVVGRATTGRMMRTVGPCTRPEKSVEMQFFGIGSSLAWCNQMLIPLNAFESCFTAATMKYVALMAIMIHDIVY